MENTPIGFALKGIKNEQFAHFEEYYSPNEEILLGAELQFKLDQVKQQIGVFFSIEFVQKKNVFLKIAVSCHFKIEKVAWSKFYNSSLGKIIIPKEFVLHLATITIGTSRGILFCKTENTVWSKFIIPSLNISEMVTKDAEFDIRDNNQT